MIEKLRFTGLALIALCGVALLGCAEKVPAELEANKQADRSNTGVNVRDRDGNTQTPPDQSENRADLDITAGIRKQVVDTKMSTNAQNVKIMTQNGKVTLRGPVKNVDEKARIEGFATAAVGVKNVDNQIEVDDR